MRSFYPFPGSISFQIKAAEWSAFARLPVATVAGRDHLAWGVLSQRPADAARGVNLAGKAHLTIYAHFQACPTLRQTMRSGDTSPEKRAKDGGLQCLAVLWVVWQKILSSSK